MVFLEHHLLFISNWHLEQGSQNINILNDTRDILVIDAVYFPPVGMWGK